ncbi:AAA family ATPase [Gordonia alkaliphila]|uniref:AAA family ATPase n=1 Tax=Gordonia alkaliphila TaxID=1053547 RepID=A0ABP8ZG98_9ACTN
MTDQHTGRRLRITLGSAVQPKRIVWWEEHWIPSAALTLLAGREGLGKSTIAVHWAARETRAGRYVIYLHSEDSREHTVVPRLLAAGADLTKVIFLDVETEFSDTGTVILPYDLEQLEDLITDYGVTFIVLDAATSAMSSTLSGKDDRQVRQYLEPLSQLAGRRDIVILGLVHFGKRDGADSGKLILGSIAWSQVARSVLSVALDPDSGKLVVTNTKGNLAPRTRSVEAHIVSTPITIDGEQTEIGVIEWLGETTADARDYLSGEDGQSNRDVDDWLTEYLKDGRQKANEIFQAADANGFSKDQVKRAKKRVGANAVKDGVWWWESPTVIEGSVVKVSVDTKGAEEQPHSRSLAPLLPSRSEGMNDCSLDPREQGSTNDPTTAPLTRSTVCRDCNISLPATATGDQCDECEGRRFLAHPEPAQPKPEPVVVHSGTTERRAAQRQVGVWLGSGEPVARKEIA